MRPTRLDPRKSYKPLDVGNGIVSGSVTPGGLWLSLGFTHPVHGRVELTDAPAFPDESRGDQVAARRYRAALASPSRKGFGAYVLRGEAEAFLVEDSLPLAVHEVGRSEERRVGKDGNAESAAILFKPHAACTHARATTV